MLSELESAMNQEVGSPKRARVLRDGTLLLVAMVTGARPALRRVDLCQFVSMAEFRRHDGETYCAPAILGYFPGKRTSLITEHLPLPAPLGRFIEASIEERSSAPGPLWSSHLYHDESPFFQTFPSVRRGRERRGYTIPTHAQMFSDFGYGAKIARVFGHRGDGSPYKGGALRKLANSIASGAPFHERYRGEPFWDAGLPVEVWCKVLLCHSLDYSITNLYRGMLSSPDGITWLRFVTTSYIWSTLTGQEEPSSALGTPFTDPHFGNLPFPAGPGHDRGPTGPILARQRTGGRGSEAPLTAGESNEQSARTVAYQPELPDFL